MLRHSHIEHIFANVPGDLHLRFSWPLGGLRCYPLAFGMKIAELMPRLLRQCSEPKCPPDADGVQIFQSLTFNWDDDFDMCRDANLADCIIYLRGATSLRIPERWRPHLPTFI